MDVMKLFASCGTQSCCGGERNRKIRGRLREARDDHMKRVHRIAVEISEEPEKMSDTSIKDLRGKLSILNRELGGADEDVDIVMGEIELK